MKKNLLKLTLFLVTFHLSNLASAQWAPHQFKTYKHAWRTAPLTSVVLKVSGFDYVTIKIVRDANQKIESTSVVFNPLFSTEEYKSTSVKNGNMIFYTTEKKDPDNGIPNFVVVGLDTLYIDANNIDTAIVEHNVDETTGAITSNRKTTYVYSGSEISNIYRYTLDASTNMYKISQFVNFVFAGNELDSAVSYSGSPSNPTLSGFSKYHHTGGKLDSIIDYSEDFNLLTFVKDQKMVATLDANGFTNKLEQYDWDSDNNTYDPLGATWVFNSLTSNPTGINELALKTSTIYPNPANNNFTIEGIEKLTLVSITNLNGQLVLQEIVRPNQQIDISNLKSGFYIVNFDGKTQKLVVE